MSSDGSKITSVFGGVTEVSSEVKVRGTAGYTGTMVYSVVAPEVVSDTFETEMTTPLHNTAE